MFLYTESESFGAIGLIALSFKSLPVLARISLAEALRALEGLEAGEHTKAVTDLDYGPAWPDEEKSEGADGASGDVRPSLTGGETLQ